MKFHKIEMAGKFKNQVLSSLPAWTSNDEGREIYLTDGTRWYGSNSKWVKYGSGGSSFDLYQVGHGFSELNAVYYNGTSWVKAQANSMSTVATHIVVDVENANNCTLAQSGKWEISGHGLANGYYYVSSTTAGQLTSTKTDPIVNEILYVMNSNEVIVLPFLPYNNNEMGGIRIVSTLPSWSASDEGSVIYVNDEDALYGATSSGWERIPYTNEINSKIIKPENFNYDSVDLGVDGGIVFNIIDTADFDSAQDGSIWFSCEFYKYWQTFKDIKLELKYSLNGTDNSKHIRLITKAWSIDTGDAPNISSPDINTTDTLTSSSSNTGKVYKETLTNGKIGNSYLNSNTTSLVFKLTREASNVADTYSGTLQLISIRIYQ